MTSETIVEQILGMLWGDRVCDRATVEALERAGVAVWRGMQPSTLTVEGWGAVERILEARARGFAIEEVRLSSNVFVLAPLGWLDVVGA